MQDPQIEYMSVILYILVNDTGIKIIEQHQKFINNDYFRKGKWAFGNDPGLNLTNLKYFKDVIIFSIIRIFQDYLLFPDEIKINLNHNMRKYRWPIDI